MVNMYQASAGQRNKKIETLVDEYSSVPLSLQTTNVKVADYWLTRFILEARRRNGKPYPANTYTALQLGC